MEWEEGEKEEGNGDTIDGRGIHGAREEREREREKQRRVSSFFVFSFWWVSDTTTEGEG